MPMLPSSSVATLLTLVIYICTCVCVCVCVCACVIKKVLDIVGFFFILFNCNFS